MRIVLVSRTLKYLLYKKVLICICPILISSCGGGSGGIDLNESLSLGSVSKSYAPQLPDSDTYPGVSWDVRLPSEVNMTESIINQALDYAFSATRNTQGVLIVRHGVIVGERYGVRKSKESTATSWSTAKSFSSALIGIALDQGFIGSIDESASNYLPSWQGTENEDISIRALLEMRSGLQQSRFSDAGIYASGGYDGDQLAFALDRARSTSPRGRNWAYQNTDSMLLSGIIENATGQDVSNYADINLFSKIGMRADWWVDERGHAMTYCCVDATTRDFARFGLLFVRQGRWRDEQLLSDSWIKESTSVPSDSNKADYALQWWVNETGGYYFSAGLHQNNIYIFPEYDLVVVRNSTYTRQGDARVRTGDNYHLTIPPANWSDSTFLSHITGAILE
ncbi:MAG: hypothetical protein CMK36_01050 [Porticoccaceae bacterium]|nr:hypothetical protein [Porticoccaceae bacterium]